MQARPAVMRVLAALAVVVLGMTTLLAKPAAAQTSFDDVSGTEFYGTAAEWLLQQGLTTGYGGTHDQPSPFFAPLVTIDRAQLVTFLWRMAGSPGGHPADGFVDTADDAYYTEAVRWARASGYTTGVGGTQAAPSPFFAPHDPVTRAQAFTLLWRYGGEPRWPKGTGPSQAYPPHQFQDTVSPSFYDLALRWAKAEGLTTGYGGSHTQPSPIFVPDGHLTRGEMAAGVWRYAGNPAPHQPGNIEEGWWVEDDAPPPPPPPPPPPVEVAIVSPTQADPATVEQGESFDVVFTSSGAAGFAIQLDDELVGLGAATAGTNTATVDLSESFPLGTYDLTVTVSTTSATEQDAVTVVPVPVVDITSPTTGEPAIVVQGGSFDAVFSTNVAAPYAIDIGATEVETGTTTVGTNTVGVDVDEAFPTGTHDLTVEVGEGAEAVSDTEADAIVVVPADGVVNLETFEVYETMPEAIGEADPDDRLRAFGTHTGVIVVNESVTLESAGATLVGSFHVTADDVTIDGFEITEIEVVPGAGITPVGIYLQEVSDVAILDNVIVGDGDGAGILTTLTGTETGLIEGNTISNVTQGIFLQGEVDVMVTDNEISDTVAGIATDTAEGSVAVITGNTFTDNEEGIGLGGPGVEVTLNTFVLTAHTTEVYVTDWVALYDLGEILADNQFDPVAEVVGNQIVPE